MQTNFFTKVAGINFIGDLQLSIRKGEGENLIVSVLPKNEQCGDSAKALIRPLDLRGTATELDNVFSAGNRTGRNRLRPHG